MNDDGTTLLPGGLRLPKSDAAMDAIGSLDELNAALGLLRAALGGGDDAALIESIQRDLLRIGAELADGAPHLPAEAVDALDAELARRNASLPPPEGFALPGTDERSARCHWARAVCRRAERDLVRARERHPGRTTPAALRHLNRLSALLFAMARDPGV